jgi:protein TonB
MSPSAPPVSRRHLAIVGSVLLLHGLALWALQSGLLQRVVELVVPVEVVSDVVELPQPKAVPVQAVKMPAPMAQPPVPRAAATPPPPVPQAVTSPTPAPNAPTGVSTPQPPAPPIGGPALPSAPGAVAVVAALVPAKVVLPSSDADYLHNPKPEYPALSKRRGEQGRVVLRVLIGADGVAQRAEVHQTSGFERLDQAGLNTVLRWRYVPGKRGGQPEAMWFQVPINFVME